MRGSHSCKAVIGQGRQAMDRLAVQGSPSTAEASLTWTRWTTFSKIYQTGARYPSLAYPHNMKMLSTLSKSHLSPIEWG